MRCIELTSFLSLISPRCPRGKTVCIGEGAPGADERGCALRSTGPYCDACVLGSWRGGGGSCNLCPDGASELVTDVMVFIACLVVVLALVVALHCLFKRRKNESGICRCARGSVILEECLSLYSEGSLSRDVKISTTILWSHYQVHVLFHQVVKGTAIQFRLRHRRCCSPPHLA